MNRNDVIATIKLLAAKLSADCIHGKFHVRDTGRGQCLITVQAQDLWADFAKDASKKALGMVQQALVQAGMSAAVEGRMVVVRT